MHPSNLEPRLLPYLAAGGVLPLLVAASTAAFSLSGWDEGASAHRRLVANAMATEEPVIVYFQTDWCGWCRRLNQEYLADGTVVRQLRRVRKVAINPEQGADEKALFRQYGGKGFPSFFVYVPAFDSRPKKLSPFRGSGASPPAQFAREIDQAIAQEYNTKGYAHSQRDQDRRAIAYYQKALEYDAENAYACHALAASYQRLATSNHYGRLLSNAKEYYCRTLEVDPDHEASKHALAVLQ
jgi:thiol-disulfide isomerase/thioredoxin